MARRGAEENGKALRRREAKTASLTTKTKPTSDGTLSKVAKATSGVGLQNRPRSLPCCQGFFLPD
jgi:hypothetical protein